MGQYAGGFGVKGDIVCVVQLLILLKVCPNIENLCNVCNTIIKHSIVYLHKILLLKKGGLMWSCVQLDKNPHYMPTNSVLNLHTLLAHPAQCNMYRYINI